jgi:hypothetical protein
VNILVVYRAGDASSESTRTRIVSALTRVGAQTTVADMRAAAVAHAFRDRATLEQAARSSGATAVYVCPGLVGSFAVISQASRATKMLSLVGEEAGVRRGLSVALVMAESRIRMLINVRSVEAEGARLDATVLGLAEVIR